MSYFRTHGCAHKMEGLTCYIHVEIQAIYLFDLLA